jgi:hypothetical protein
MVSDRRLYGALPPPAPLIDEEAARAALVSAAVAAARAGVEIPHYCWHAGLSVCRALFAEPYLSTDPAHQGLLLHAVYHRPNGWDTIPEGRVIPCGESCMS